MNVGELRAALTEWPDNTPIAVIDDTFHGDDLDTDLVIAPAINHPDLRHARRFWHWCTQGGPDGELVLVIH